MRERETSRVSILCVYDLVWYTTKSSPNPSLTLLPPDVSVVARYLLFPSSFVRATFREKGERGRGWHAGEGREGAGRQELRARERLGGGPGFALALGADQGMPCLLRAMYGTVRKRFVRMQAFGALQVSVGWSEDGWQQREEQLCVLFAAAPPSFSPDVLFGCIESTGCVLALPSNILHEQPTSRSAPRNPPMCPLRFVVAPLFGVFSVPCALYCLNAPEIVLCLSALSLAPLRLASACAPRTLLLPPNDVPAVFRRTARWQFEGELAVKEAFPEATIVRPAKLFGNDDRLLTWIALMATRTGRVPLVSVFVSLVESFFVCLGDV